MKRRPTYPWACILLLAAFTLEGCRRQPQPTENGGTEPIRFGAASAVDLSAQVQAAKAINVSFPQNGDAFSVFGDWTPPGYSTSAHVFINEPVSWDGSEWSYAAAHQRYWQWGGEYNFKAVYPSTASFDSNSNGKIVLVQYSMYNDYDLMVASAQRTVSISDPLPHDPVNFQFRHACCAGKFVFKKGPVATEYRLKSFEIQNVRAIGTFYYNTDSDITTDNWMVSDNRAASVCVHNDLDVLIDESYHAETGTWHYVIPQDLNPGPNDAKPSVHFTVAVGSGPNAPIVPTTIELPTTYDHDGDPLTPEVDMVWEPGQVYVYRILIEPTEVTITVEKTEWDPATLAVDDIVIY